MSGGQRQWHFAYIANNGRCEALVWQKEGLALVCWRRQSAARLDQFHFT
jgi:hypothetical protein